MSFAFAKTSDYKGAAFLDENLRVGVGMTYSKLENGSTVGNYFLLSQANPKIEISYDTGVQDLFRQKFSTYVVRELFRPENNSLRVKTDVEHTNYGLAWQPMWVSEGIGYSYGLIFGLKAGSVISEIPDPFNIRGDIATRYSGVGGLSFVWYGTTVSKFPLSIDLDLLYSQNIFDTSALTYYNGFIYRFGLEFDFKKKTLFSNWNLRAFYEYEDVKNGYGQFVNKEIGAMVKKVFVF